MADIPRRLYVVSSVSEATAYVTPDRTVAMAALETGEWVVFEFGRVGRLRSETISAASKGNVL